MMCPTPVMTMLEPQLFITNVDRAMQRQALSMVANGGDDYWAWKDDKVRLTVHFEGDVACWQYYFILGNDLFENGYFLTRSAFGGRQLATRETVADMVNAYFHLIGEVLA